MTARQFYFTLFIFSICLRVQKMPAFLADKLGKDSYLLILFFFVVDIIGILLAFFILKCLNKYDFSAGNKISHKIIKSSVFLLIALYFALQALLMYEAIQDLFSHILFDNLPWTLFSLLLIATVFYLAFGGLKGLGRVVEVFFWLITISFALLAIFGGMQTNFSTVLPFETIDFNKICDNFLTFNLWFGDFFLILFLGRHSKDIKLKWTLLTYSIAMCFVILVIIEFYGMYDIFSTMQSSLISMLSEQSMLGIDIGRVDWFLILFTEIGTILCSALCLYFASYSLTVAFPKAKRVYMLSGLTAILYLVDVIFLVDTNIKEIVFLGFSSYFSIILKCTLFLLLLLVCIAKHAKNQKANKLQVRSNA